MLTIEKINEIIREYKNGLTIVGGSKPPNRPLKRNDIEEGDAPEEYTKRKLIEPLIIAMGIKIAGKESRLENENGAEYPDTILISRDGSRHLCEMKPVGTKLDSKRSNSAKTQLEKHLRLRATEKYKTLVGINGYEWLFINAIDGECIGVFDIERDYAKIEEILNGKTSGFHKHEEEISKKFYNQYIALIHLLINNIMFVPLESDRREIARSIMDRLIFITFLQSKGIIKRDILSYLYNLNDDNLNEKMGQLFFQVLNTSPDDRTSIDPQFSGIPYLNGSLFVRTNAEINNQDYRIDSKILRSIIDFLNSFKFISDEDDSSETTLDPKILGYIFEKEITKKDKKDTGSYYTPEIVTRYISENTINRYIIEKSNVILTNRGYKESETIKAIKELCSKVKPTTLRDIFDNIISTLRICDPACGSGAFLLAAANILLDTYKAVNTELRFGLTEIGMKKSILKNNIFGVDTNPGAVEIAKLRLWLWLVSSYTQEEVEPLPNIDYNLRVGSSLHGLLNYNESFEDSFIDKHKDIDALVGRRYHLVGEYKDLVGEDAKNHKKEIEKLDEEINQLLNTEYYRIVNERGDIKFKDYLETQPLHYMLEFYEAFRGNNTNECGFDIIIGNPPYGNLLTPTQKEMSVEYSTRDSGEISANFVERIICITKKDGYIGLALPLSIAINKNASKSRSAIRKYMSDSRMALFDSAPARMFQGADERIILFIGKKDCMGIDGMISTTNFIKITKNQSPRNKESTLLDDLHFENTDGLALGKYKIGDGLADTSLPKIGHPIIRNIIIKLKKKSEITVWDVTKGTKGEYKIVFRTSGRYWLDALEEMPYISTMMEKTTFDHSIERDFLIILIPSSLCYLYWTTYGDSRHFQPSLLYKFPMPNLNTLNENKNEIERLKNDMCHCLLKNFVKKKDANRFKTNLCKNTIDEIDDLLGKIYDLNKDETEFIKQYDHFVRKK